jgi:type II secretory pathway pseudopilin PulG
MRPVRPARRRRAMTLVEIMIVVILFALAIGLAADTYLRSVSAERKLGVKIDLLHHAQVASLHVSRQLRLAVEIFAPPVGLDQTRPYLVFSDETNHLKVIHVNEKKELVELDRNANDEGRVLATGVTRFRVFRKGRRMVVYHLHLKDELAGERFNLISGACIRNNIN